MISFSLAISELDRFVCSGLHSAAVSTIPLPIRHSLIGYEPGLTPGSTSSAPPNSHDLVRLRLLLAQFELPCPQRNPLLSPLTPLPLKLHGLHLLSKFSEPIPPYLRNLSTMASGNQDPSRIRRRLGYCVWHGKKPPLDPFNNWKRKNQFAKSLLIQLVSTDYMANSGNSATACDAWMNLEGTRLQKRYEYDPSIHHNL